MKYSEQGLRRLAVRLVSPYNHVGQYVDASLDDLAKLDAAIGQLTPREQQIIKMRWLDDPKHTLEQTGAELDNKITGSKGVTQERVRQIEAKAMRKLRHPDRGVPFESWTVREEPDWFARELGEYASQHLRSHIREDGGQIESCSLHGDLIDPQCSECKETLSAWRKGRAGI